MMDEGIDLIKGLWRGERVYSGQHYVMDLSGRTDLSDVAAAGSQDRERRTVRDRHQEQETVVHLDNGLQDGTTLEAPGRPLGETDQTGRDCRQLVSAITRKVP